MAETSMLWTTNGTGHGVSSGYASNRWQNFLRKLFLSDQAASACVLAGVDNELAVSGTSSPLSVATGAAIGYAFLYENDAPVNLTVTTPVVNITGGHVVLRTNYAAQTVTVVAVRNTDGVAAIPSLTQSAGVTWETRLASFTITTGGVIALTDTRKRAKFSNHVYSGNLDTSVADAVGIEVSSGVLRLKDLGVVTAKINDLAVTTAKIADLNVTTGKIANDSIDDTKAGNRVAQFYRRQGGSATDWQIAGTTTYTPTSVRTQAGVRTNTGASSVVVTFPTAFSQPPIVVATGRQFVVTVVSATASNFTVQISDFTGAGATDEFFWIAFGPE